MRLLSNVTRTCINTQAVHKSLFLTRPLVPTTAFSTHLTPFSRPAYSTMSESGFYSLKAELPGGKEYNFADLKGKTVLIVNVASKWYAILLHWDQKP